MFNSHLTKNRGYFSQKDQSLMLYNESVIVCCDTTIIYTYINTLYQQNVDFFNVIPFYIYLHN